ACTLLAAIAGEPGTNTSAASMPHANSDLIPLLIEIPLVASVQTAPATVPSRRIPAHPSEEWFCARARATPLVVRSAGRRRPGYQPSGHDLELRRRARALHDVDQEGRGPASDLPVVPLDRRDRRVGGQGAPTV